MIYSTAFERLAALTAKRCCYDAQAQASFCGLPDVMHTPMLEAQLKAARLASMAASALTAFCVNLLLHALLALL